MYSNMERQVVYCLVFYFCPFLRLRPCSLLTKARLLFIYFALWTLAAASFIVCAEVITMAVLQDEIFDTCITELRERALSEFRHSEKENQNRYDRSADAQIFLCVVLNRLLGLDLIGSHFNSLILLLTA